MLTTPVDPLLNPQAFDPALARYSRQILFDEDDVAGNPPKARAAADKLGRVNADMSIEPVFSVCAVLLSLCGKFMCRSAVFRSALTACASAMSRIFTFGAGTL